MFCSVSGLEQRDSTFLCQDCSCNCSPENIYISFCSEDKVSRHGEEDRDLQKQTCGQFSHFMADQLSIFCS